MSDYQTSFAKNRYVAGENDVVFYTAPKRPRGVIFCHSAGSSARHVNASAKHRALLGALAQHATVHAGDLGGNPFGNPLGVTRIGQAIDSLRRDRGQVGPVVLVGQSMGAANALNYALRYPDEVAAVVGIVPGLDFADLHARAPFIARYLDKAYPPVYDDATDGPDRSPIRFATRLPTGLPIHLWSSSNDPYAVPATARAFVTARPQTGLTDMGKVGHSLGNCRDGVVTFVNQFTA